MAARNERRKTRREFFESAAAAGLPGTASLPLSAEPEQGPDGNATGGDARRDWVPSAEKLARPVLENLARRELKRTMPVGQLPGAGRERFTHLEASGRLLCGLAPWLAADGLGGAERKL